MPDGRRRCWPRRGGLCGRCRHRSRRQLPRSVCGPRRRFLRRRFFCGGLLGGSRLGCRGRELHDDRVWSKSGRFTRRPELCPAFRNPAVAVEREGHSRGASTGKRQRAGRTACLAVGRFGFGPWRLGLEADGVQHGTGFARQSSSSQVRKNMPTSARAPPTIIRTRYIILTVPLERLEPARPSKDRGAPMQVQQIGPR